MSEASPNRLFAEEAARAGFHRIGFATAGPWPRGDRYEAWVAAGYAGEMSYLVRDRALRLDPRALMPAARSVVVVALAYSAAPTAAGDGEGGPRGFVARYARGADYHMVMKPRLGRLAEAVAARLGRPFAYRVCVDTAPLLEREAAHAAGVGFSAKNTLIIAPGLGSYLLLGELLVDLELVPSAPSAPRCGQCRACLDACPTDAFVGPNLLDGRRCISYLTIENPGPIPRSLRPRLENMIFGCDRCQEVCPFNASAGAGSPDLAPSPRLDGPPLAALLTVGAAQFRKRVQRTALRRLHRRQLLRNVAVALGNVGTPAELPALVAALDEPSPLVQAHVAWAIGALGRRWPGVAEEAAMVLRRRLATPVEPEVREELLAALAEIDGLPRA